jgi:DNA polymerase-3 subunit delta
VDLIHTGHYFIWGQDPYLLDEKIETIVAGIQAGEEAQRLSIDANELSAADLGEILEFSPLFSLARVIIIRNPYWLEKSDRKAKQKQAVEAVWKDYFSRPHEGQYVIISSRDYQAKNPIARLLKQHCQLIKVPALTGTEKEKWLSNACKQRGLKASPAVIKQMVAAKQDLYYLSNMLDKFSLQGIQVIQTQHLEAELDNMEEIKVFKLSDACLQRNTKAGIQTFHQLEEQGVPYLMMTAMIRGQFILMARVKFYHERGYSLQQIESMLGYKPFVIKKMHQLGEKFSSEEIRFVFQRLLQIDISFKSQSRDQRQLIEAFIIEVCSH